MNENTPEVCEEDVALSIARECVSGIGLYKLNWQESIIVRDEIAERLAEELRKYITDSGGTVTP